MYFDPFSLPGPQAFIRKLDLLVRDGISIIVENVPQSIAEDLWNRLNDLKLGGLRSRKSPSYGQSPIEAIHNTISCKCALKHMTFEYLYSLEDFKGNILKFYVEDQDNLIEWVQYVYDFADHTRRGVQDLDKSAFVLFHTFPLQNKMDESPSIIHIDGSKIFSKYDLNLYVNMQTNLEFGSELARSLYITIVSELSGNDLKLCDSLLRYDLRELIDDLYRIAHHVNIQGNEAAWDLAKWKAQLQVIFPQLEILRRNLIEQYSDSFTMPHINQRNGRTTRRKLELELSDIKYQANYYSLPISEEHFRVLGKAVAMRNQIAHYETVSYDDFVTLQIGLNEGSKSE